MPLVPAQDLWDAAAQHSNVRVTCRRCAASKIFHAAALWWLFQCNGWSGRLGDVRRRFYCAVCWARHRQRVYRPELEPVDDAATDTSLPLPSELDWKREARRRR